MDVARRMHVHLPDRIVVQDLKGMHVTSVHRMVGGGDKQIYVIGFVWHTNSSVKFCCEHDKVKLVLMKYIQLVAS